jgi:ribosome-associated protein
MGNSVIQITPSITLDDKDLAYEYIRASGPGGQNVNKVATAVQLRFDLANSTSLSPEVKQRLKKLAGSRLTLYGSLIIEAKRYRTQEQNRYDAEQRLAALVSKALVPPKPRRPTHPTAASAARRLEAKKHRGQTKRLRQSSTGGSHEEI